MEYDISKYFVGVEYRAFFWLMIALFFLVLELGNPGLFFFLSFCIGALITMGATLFGFETVIPQIGIFFTTSLLSFVCLKMWLKRATVHSKKTNSDALIGKSGIVMKTILVESPGLVKIGGEVWSARSLHGAIIATGASIKVVAVSGAHLIVNHS